MRLSYVDSAGENVHLDSATAPWSIQVDAAGWGADADPSVVVLGPEHGDAFVSCSITDRSGQVVASDREESASPVVSCRNW